MFVACLPPKKCTSRSFVVLPAVTKYNIMTATVVGIGIIPILAFVPPLQLFPNYSIRASKISRRYPKIMAEQSFPNHHDDDDDAVDVDIDSDDTAAAAIDFLTLTRSLKTTKRTGWVMHGVHNPESIADHMYRMSLMAMIASSNGAIDTNKCIKLALIHDLAEARVGDITPRCGVSDQDKYNLELGTMEEIRGMLGSTMGGDEIVDLWKEYEEGRTEEAKLLKDLDKLEMILQAQEYEAEGSHEQSLDQFFTSTEGKWRTEIGKAWATEIISRRRKKKMGES